ncbi:Protein TIFY 6B [Linum perenne]
MERDFMGLLAGSKRLSSVTVKDEQSVAVAGFNDSAVTMRNPGGAHQWSFSNKVSAVPQFLSFQAASEEKPRKNVFDPIASSNYMSISSADAFDSSSKRGSAMQRNWFNDREAGSHRAMTGRPVQHIDAFPVGSNKDIRMFPFSNQRNQQVAVSLSTPILHSHFASSSAQSGFRNSISIKQQPLGGVPVTAPVSAVPATTSSVIGTTELRNSPKVSGSPAQLTIFYNGSVCVYDDISPEKAQAVMSMARSGSPAVHNKTAPATTFKLQSEIRSPLLSIDHHHLVGNKSCNTTPAGSSMPSAISVSSSTSSESGTTKSRVGSSSISHAEPSSSKQISSSVAASVATLPLSAGLPQACIPQARKASLARFLEKRKERVTSSSPYAMGKKSGEGDVCA